MSDEFEIVQPSRPLANRIRDFFETLFTGRLVLQLRADLEEARARRDDFKGRAERLELQLLQPRVAAHSLDAGTAQPRAHPTGTLGGRKTWQQIVSDRRKQLAELAAEKQKKPETSAPTASAPPTQN